MGKWKCHLPGFKKPRNEAEVGTCPRRTETSDKASTGFSPEKNNRKGETAREPTCIKVKKYPGKEKPDGQVEVSPAGNQHAEE